MYRNNDLMSCVFIFEFQPKSIHLTYNIQIFLIIEVELGIAKQSPQWLIRILFHLKVSQATQVD